MLLRWRLWLVVGMAVGLGALRLPVWKGAEAQADSAQALLGSRVVKQAYARWVTEHEAHGGDRAVQVALGYNKGLSGAFTRANGTAELDLVDGRVSVDVHGLDAAGDFEVWLVDNRGNENASVAPEASDVRVLAGALVRTGTDGELHAQLGAQVFQHMQVDLVAVAPAGLGAEKGLLFGSTPLFQRIYTALRTPALLQVSDYAPERPARTVAQFFATAEAADQPIFVDPDTLFDRLVVTGADLFINGTFKGNGRTCATCHPMGHNTQLSVSDVAALPDRDPLFAAEFQPALAFDPAGPKFEVPALMRGAALILENQDGMDDLANKFNMRGIPHTLGLTTSITAPPGPPGPVQRTGWSGDGAPNTGSLRDFATGAVTQHFTKTLARVPGQDFRLPNDAELDAMEAFQLSLGRQQDVTLPLPFTSPIVLLGQQLFTANGPVGAGNCNVCHLNAGASAAPFIGGGNQNFNTGVESQLNRPVHTILTSLGLDLTPGEPGNLVGTDGGFGLGDPTQNGAGTGSSLLGFGNGTFNTPPLVEAADSGPFFHDNSVRTIEGAVAFYNSTAFNSSPSGAFVQIRLQATQVEAIAAFLRALNALENIRSASELLAASDNVRVNAKAMRELHGRATSEIEDAIRVLAGADLHPEAVASLRSALRQVGRDFLFPRRSIRSVLRLLEEARGDIIAAS